MKLTVLGDILSSRRNRGYRHLVWLASVVFLVLWTSPYSASVKTEVVAYDGGYTLVRDGKPYLVRGAGAGLVGDLASVAARGGNSIRNWGIEVAQETLDEAHKHGLTVLMGLPVAAERFGMDYDDEAEKEKQRETIKAAVLEYKDHPALLGWIIGNELDMRFTNHGVYDEVNAISKMIHELDPLHPTTTTISDIKEELVILVRERAPDLDFLSLQVYGALFVMPKAISYLKEGPFMITEWGPLGHWEVGKTKWGAPVEMHSTEKAKHYLTSYRDLIAPYLDYALGSYVFLWGQKQERTSTWFSLFTETGEATAAVDAMEIAWAGRLPKNQAPVVESFSLARRGPHDSVRLSAGKRYSARAKIFDPEEDELTYQWQIKPESQETVVGGDFEQAIAEVSDLFVGDATGDDVKFHAPSEAGEYRIFLMVYDGQGNAAHANIPFLVFGNSR